MEMEDVHQLRSQLISLAEGSGKFSVSSLVEARFRLASSLNGSRTLHKLLSQAEAVRLRFISSCLLIGISSLAIAVALLNFEGLAAKVVAGLMLTTAVILQFGCIAIADAIQRNPASRLTVLLNRGLDIFFPIWLFQPAASPITIRGDYRGGHETTLLHVAVMLQRTSSVKCLLSLLGPSGKVDVLDCRGRTAESLIAGLPADSNSSSDEESRVLVPLSSLREAFNFHRWSRRSSMLLGRFRFENRPTKQQPDITDDEDSNLAVRLFELPQELFEKVVLCT